MGFNELNSVEHYIIHQLSGSNLNSTALQEPKEAYITQRYHQSVTNINRSLGVH
jgi:type I restriction enzyme R subunit